VLKPGQYFAVDELCLTERFDPSNSIHRDIKAEIELGCGLPDLRSTRLCIQAMKDAGFEVVFAKDMTEDFPCPWYQKIEPGVLSWTSFFNSGLGKFITQAMVYNHHIHIRIYRVLLCLISWVTFCCVIVFYFQTGALEFLRIAPKGSNRMFSTLRKGSHGLVTGSK